MNIRIGNQTWQYENNETGLTAFLKDLNKYLLEQDLYISLCNIDDMEFYQDFENELSYRFNEAAEIEILTVNLAEMITNNIASLYEYLDRALPEMDQLAAGIYEGKEAWKQFEQMLEGLEWIERLMNALQSYKAEREELCPIVNIQNSFSQIVQAISEALDADDAVLISDTIKYELAPLLLQIKGKAKEYLMNGEKRNVVN